MVGNGYELTLRKNEMVFKGSIITADYKESLKAKNSFSDKVRNNPLSKTTFRCVKRVFSPLENEDQFI